MNFTDLFSDNTSLFILCLYIYIPIGTVGAVIYQEQFKNYRFKNIITESKQL